ncbi:MAG: HAMP domain-containing protein [Spirochaetia bacterium]|nr:HAMP domain-containing protein [Spirochaetia bacterium]
MKSLLFSFRFRLWAGATLINGILIPAIIFFSYMRNREILIESMASRLVDSGRISVLSFTVKEKNAFINISRKLSGYRISDEKISKMQPGEFSPSVPEKKLKEIYGDPDFELLIKRLRRIKLQVLRLEKEKDLMIDREPAGGYTLDQYKEKNIKSSISYIYLAVPYEDRPDIVRYVADADFEADSSDEGNPPGNIYKTKQNSFLSALEGIPASESSFISDSWGLWLTAAVPIRHEGRVIGLLGMDYDATGDTNKIKDLLFTSLILGAAFLPFSLILTYLLASWLANPIKKISEAAGKVRKRDFSAEVSLKQKDEIGQLGDTFNQMVVSIRNYSTELEDLNQAYYKFVPKEFLDQLGIDSIAHISLGHEVKKDMTVLFSDIRSFTTISESMKPEENFQFLNSYLNTAAPIIRKYEGFIDKYIGDAIMALFPHDPGKAIQTGIDMIHSLIAHNEITSKEGWPPVRVGVGIHTGSLMMGTIGEEKRLQTTVIADAVNLAARLESLTKKLGVHIIVSRNTLDTAVGNQPDKFYSRFLGSVRVKGKTKGVEIYEILNCHDVSTLEQRLNSKPEFEHAVKLLMSGKLSDAERLFENIIKTDPSDKAAEFMLKRSRK